MSVKWKRPAGECPYFIAGGYKYFLQQDYRSDYMWYVGKVLNKPIEVQKRDSLKQIYIDLIGHPASFEESENWQGMTNRQREEEYDGLLRTYTEGFNWNDNIRRYIRTVSESSDNKPHYFAVDLSDKKWWEYYEDEKVSGLFSTEKEAKKAAEVFWEKENGRQMSLFDYTEGRMH